MSPHTAFHENFGEGERCDLDTTYRFNSRIGEVANRFIQQNPGQLKKPLNSLTNGDKKAVTLLDESQLDALLEALWLCQTGRAHSDPGALPSHEPASLEKAATRWPKLQIDFMTIHASKGQQADYVIIVGLQEGSDGFPAAARSRLWKRRYCHRVEEDFPDAEERRLMYVALTRARHRVWALFNKENPSPFVEILKNLDVPVARKTVRNRWRLPPVQYYFRRSAR